MNYSYDPSKIRGGGKDQMRFELGDTAVEGGGETCALSDEEYNAFIEEATAKGNWARTKLALVEAILHKFSFQVDTKIDVLTYNFSARAEHWQALYETLKQEVSAVSVPLAGGSVGQPYYFHTDMNRNRGGA